MRKGSGSESEEILDSNAQVAPQEYVVQGAPYEEPSSTECAAKAISEVESLLQCEPR